MDEPVEVEAEAEPDPERETAKRAIRQGAAVGFFAAAVTFVLTIVAFVTDGEGILRLFKDPIRFADAGILALCASWVRRGSRVAAVVMAFVALVGILFSVIAGHLVGLAVGLLLFFAMRAARGTFVLHRLRRAEGGGGDPTPRWIWWLLGPFLLLLLAAAVMGLLSEAGVIPALDVVAGSEMRESDLELLRKKRILAEDEEVVLFYSAGLLSILEDGNILTDRRAISYETVDGTTVLHSMDYERIVDVTLDSAGGIFEDAIILVTTDENIQYGLLAAHEGHEKFLAELTTRWKRAVKELEERK